MSRDTRIKSIEIVRTGIGEIANEFEHFEFVATEGCIPKNRDDIKLYADEPCVEACQRLYDLNIRTYTSSGHVDGKENATGLAYIGIDYDSLSDENKEIVYKLLEEGRIKCLIAPSVRNNFYSFNIETIIHSDSLVGEVSDQLLELVNNFYQQDVLYGRSTIQELKDKYFSKQEDGTYIDEILLEGNLSDDELKTRFIEYLNDGYFGYTDDGETFFVSEDLLRKHTDYVKSLTVTKIRQQKL